MSTQIIALLVVAVWVVIIGLGLLLGRLLIETRCDKRLWGKNLSDEWDGR